MLDAAALAHTAPVHPSTLRRNRTASAVQGDQVLLQLLRFLWRQKLCDPLPTEVDDHAPEAWIAVFGHSRARRNEGPGDLCRRGYEDLSRSAAPL